MKGKKGLNRRIKLHVNAKEHDFFAIVHPGFEMTAKRELELLGVEEFIETVEGGIEFKSRLDTCYRINLCSRTITRLIMRLTKFRAERFNKLRSKIRKFPWEVYIKNMTAIGFNIVSKESRLYHKKRIAEELGKGILERLADFGIDIDLNNEIPEKEIQKIFVRVYKNRFQLSLDTSGEVLYKRGYKQEITGAPIRETLASLILYEAGINNYDLLIDPMCGTGTFSLEAAGIFSNSIPGKNRHFIFMKWPAYRENAYKHLRNKLIGNEFSCFNNEKKIIASDKSQVAIEAAGDNFKKAGLIDYVTLERLDFFKDDIIHERNKKSFIVLNPPYGSRIKDPDLKKLYRKIGKRIRSFYPDSGYAIISPSLEYEKIMSLPYDRKILFVNGGIKVGVIIKDAS